MQLVIFYLLETFCRIRNFRNKCIHHSVTERCQGKSFIQLNGYQQLKHISVCSVLKSSARQHQQMMKYLQEQWYIRASAYVLTALPVLLRNICILFQDVHDHEYSHWQTPHTLYLYCCNLFTIYLHGVYIDSYQI